MAKPTILALYDPNSPTKVCADASSYGLGAVLMQQQNSQWRPIAYASRSMTETEQRYAQIEKEALAATWACEKFSSYILGLKFSIETDHKPLVPLLGSKQLDKLPPRVLRFRLRLARFTYTISQVSGKLLYTADTLSRAPVHSSQNDGRLQEEAEMLMELSVRNLPASPQTRANYKKAQSEDPICSAVIKYCQNTWPKRKGEIDEKLIPYFKARGDLSVTTDGMLLPVYQNRIVVPKSLQRRTLDKIHTGHQGVQRCRLLANTAVWWPGMSQEVENMVLQCLTCAKDTKPAKQEMIASDLPEYPWQKIGTDLFQLKGKSYLVVVDYFSRYPEVRALNSTTSSSIIKVLKDIFSRFGIPEIVMSDNGPQYASCEFADFAKLYDFEHITSSPCYPQSNGQVERTVQTVKRLLKQSEDP